MIDSKTFNFEDFIMANKGRSRSSLDYLHTVYKAEGLPSDFIVHFAKLFSPTLKVIDGAVFLEELFDVEQYRKLIDSGRTLKEVQYWMNLVEVTGLFDELSFGQAEGVAKSIVLSWSAKINECFPGMKSCAKYIFDKEAGEVFVTIEFRS